MPPRSIQKRCDTRSLIARIWCMLFINERAFPMRMLLPTISTTECKDFSESRGRNLRIWWCGAGTWGLSSGRRGTRSSAFCTPGQGLMITRIDTGGGEVTRAFIATSKPLAWDARGRVGRASEVSCSDSVESFCALALEYFACASAFLRDLRCISLRPSRHFSVVFAVKSPNAS